MFVFWSQCAEENTIVCWGSGSGYCCQWSGFCERLILYDLSFSYLDCCSCSFLFTPTIRARISFQRHTTPSFCLNIFLNIFVTTCNSRRYSLNVSVQKWLRWLIAKRSTFLQPNLVLYVFLNWWLIFIILYALFRTICICATYSLTFF